MKKFSRVLLTALASLMIFTGVVGAAAPYATYTYSSEGFVLNSPEAYVPDMVVDSEYMGLDVVLDDPRDLFVGPDDCVYIVDAKNARVICLDKYFKFRFQIKSFVNSHGVPDSFSDPSGVFVNEEHIYVCDTDNNRIVMFDLEGNYVKIIKKPESNLFEEGSIYKPVACAVDQYGRLFVVSSTTYQGIIVINDDSEFFGFIGATKTVGSVMENIGWAVISNLHILFAAAIGGSWAKEKAGGAFAAVIAFILINNITGAVFGPQIRKDWLDKLGLEMPHDPESLYQVLKAFRDRDPNGNGKKDEIPMVGSNTLYCADAPSWIMNNFGEYVYDAYFLTYDENGNMVVYGYGQEEVRETGSRASAAISVASSKARLYAISNVKNFVAEDLICREIIEDVEKFREL